MSSAVHHHRKRKSNQHHQINTQMNKLYNVFVYFRQFPDKLVVVFYTHMFTNLTSPEFKKK